MKNFSVLFLLFLGLTVLAQNEQPPYTPASSRIDQYQKHQKLIDQSIVNSIKFRSVGPTVFSGRVSDLEVRPDDPSHFYVGYSSGGLWKTENNGISFTPLFDNEMVMTIGDIAVDWERNTIWIGTGEVNSSRSSYAGIGIYKSADGGTTWEHLGLEESHHIGRIILHPNDPNTLWVAVLGHLYSPNPERGVFKTTDGGKTWRKTLYVNENTGAVDLIIDPANPDELFAAAWERTRRAWDFTESGAGSGIYHSADGGESWQLVSGEGSGFPHGAGAGRIGLDIIRQNGKTTLFAAIDNYFRRDKEEPEEEELTKDQLREMDKETFLSLKKYLITDYLRKNNFPREYSADKVLQMVKEDEIAPVALVEYTEDANSLLFDTPVIGLEIYRSEDGGKSWSRTHEKHLEGVYFSYGYYFGQIRVAPRDPDKLYVLGVPVLRSSDGGKTWKSIGGENVHADHHALWVNPERQGHLILGNDGGVNISYDDGETWIKCNAPALGQFYALAADMAEPYNIYGGLQDNGVWMGPSNYEAGNGWQASGHYPYREILGGDGMQVQVDTRDNETVYTGFQFGNYFRLNTRTGERKRITPSHKLGERPFRWNWQTPIHLSVHNQDILYMGSNILHRSMDKGDNFTAISGDLTTGGRKGDVAYSTLTTIHESPLKFGMIYVGSDDGLVHLTRDGGTSWKLLSEGLPKRMWVSRVQASAFEEGTVYLSLNGYRWDDFTPYLYRSSDYGATWQEIGQGLPPEPVNVIKEDPVNPEILYVGTDNGLYISLDRGATFMLMNNGLPAVAVHDLIVHPREHDLIVGTHGRSIYLGNVKELQQLTDEIMSEPLYVFDMPSIRASGRWGNSSYDWSEPNTPEMSIPLYADADGAVEISIKSGDLTLRSFAQEVTKGLNYVPYDLSIDEKISTEYEKLLNKSLEKEEKPKTVKPADNGKTYLQAGKYQVVAEKNKVRKEKSLEIK